MDNWVPIVYRFPCYNKPGTYLCRFRIPTILVVWLLRIWYWRLQCGLLEELGRLGHIGIETSTIENKKWIWKSLIVSPYWMCKNLVVYKLKNHYLLPILSKNNDTKSNVAQKWTYEVKHVLIIYFILFHLIFFKTKPIVQPFFLFWLRLCLKNSTKLF